MPNPFFIPQTLNRSSLSRIPFTSLFFYYIIIIILNPSLNLLGCIPKTSKDFSFHSFALLLFPLLFSNTAKTAKISPTCLEFPPQTFLYISNALSRVSLAFCCSTLIKWSPTKKKINKRRGDKESNHINSHFMCSIS